MRNNAVAPLVSILLTLGAGAAHATGLALPAPAGGSGPATTLGALQSLTATARLATTGVELTEVRNYALPQYAGTTVTATFYSSVLGPATATAPTVTVAGQPVTGSLLAPEEADGARRRLTIDLHDPTALRGLGLPLYVSDPVSIAVPASGAVEVQVTSRGPLLGQGTMAGLVVPVDWARPTVPTVDVKITAGSEMPFRALYSPFHPLSVVRDGVNAARASYSGHGVCTDLDLTLLFSSGEGLVHLDLVPFRYGDGEREDGTFLAMITPDPTPVVDRVLPRDLALVIDTSGSMSGVKMTQAKQALRGVLTGLRTADSFSLISFATDVKSFQSAAMLRATAENVEAALAFVDALAANGSTNIDAALHTGIGSLTAESGRPRYVVFLTDGQPTVGVTGVDAIVANVLAQNEVGARIFSFGIGNDVNTNLLDKLARETAGDVIYVRPEQDVATAVDAFFQQISDPVLADAMLDLGGFAAADVFPEKLPDLFAGRTVTLLGRYTAHGRSAVVLSGSRDGQPWSQSYDVAMPEHAFASGYVPRIWATRQVGRLLAKIKEGNTDQALVDEVVRLANRFGVATAYTPFRTDAQGNVANAYSAVPVAQTGAAAVDASSSLRDYNNTGSVPVGGTPTTPTGSPAVVRYTLDRTLPPQNGYLTDSKLAASAASMVDLAFGSEGYFAFARAEAGYGAGALLAIGSNVRFELLGRSFRVTDSGALPMGVAEPPPETSGVPAPAWRPATGGLPVIVTSTGVPTPVADTVPRPPEDGPSITDPGLSAREGCACATATSGSGDPAAVGPAWLLGLLSAVSIARRRSARNTRRAPL